MVTFADQCLALPLKRHFWQDRYEESLDICKVFKGAATELLPLERKWLVLLDTDSCGNDILECSDYDKIKNEIVAIIKQADADLDEIYNR